MMIIVYVGSWIIMYSAQRVQCMYMDHVLEKKMGSLLQYLMHNVMTTIGQQSFYLDAVLDQKYRINLPLCLSSPFMSLVSWNWRDWGIDHRTTADDVSWEWSIMNNNVVVQFTQIIAHLVQCIYTHVSCSGVLEKKEMVSISGTQCNDRQKLLAHLGAV